MSSFFDFWVVSTYTSLLLVSRFTYLILIKFEREKWTYTTLFLIDRFMYIWLNPLFFDNRTWYFKYAPRTFAYLASLTPNLMSHTGSSDKQIIEEEKINKCSDGWIVSDMRYQIIVRKHGIRPVSLLFTKLELWTNWCAPNASPNSSSPYLSKKYLLLLVSSYNH